MAFTKANPGTWGTNDELTSAQMNALDTDHANSLDKTIAGDTLAGIVQLSGVGRLVMTAVDGADANTTYQPGDYRVIQISSTISADRSYTLGTTNAQTNDVIEVFCLSTLSYTVTIIDGGTASAIWAMSNKGGLSGSATAAGLSSYAAFIYRAGAWRPFRSSNRGINAATFSSSGTFTTPANCTQLLCFGYGGGGGGGGGGACQNASTTEQARGGGGGGGSWASWQYMATSASTAHTVTIGAGGAGGSGGAASATLSTRLGGTGTYGGNTIVDNGSTYLIWYGGGGGSGYLLSDASAGSTPKEATVGGGPVSGAPFPAVYTSAWLPYYNRPDVPGYGGCGKYKTTLVDFPSDGLTGNASGGASAGSGGTAGSDGATSGGYIGGGGGGGGGGGPGGSGANGANGANGNNGGPGGNGSSASAAAGNTGAGGGGGGGGGAGSTTAGTGGNGSAGGSGKVIVIWF